MALPIALQTTTFSQEFGQIFENVTLRIALQTITFWPGVQLDMRERDAAQRLADHVRSGVQLELRKGGAVERIADHV